MNEMEQLSRWRTTIPVGVTPRAEALYLAALQQELDPGSAGYSRPDGSSARTGRRRRRIMAIGGAAGATAVAAATAVALVVIPTGRPHAGQSSATSSSAAATAPSAGGHPALSPAQSRLTRLAAYIAASTPRQPGNATLIARTTTIAAPNPQAGTARVYDLYADSGAYYFGRTESGLAAQVAGHHATGGNWSADEVAAARYAVHGDLATARLRMAGMSHSPTRGMHEAEVKFEAAELGVKAAPGQSLRDAVGKAMLDNYVWENCLAALEAGAGNPQVRAGVLRLVSTVSGITVTTATAAGQPTLLVADVTPGLNGGQPYDEALTLSARTGIPIKFIGAIVGHRPDTTTTYQVSRVTIAAIAAGRF